MDPTSVAAHTDDAKLPFGFEACRDSVDHAFRPLTFFGDVTSISRRKLKYTLAHTPLRAY